MPTPRCTHYIYNIICMYRYAYLYIIYYIYNRFGLCFVMTSYYTSLRHVARTIQIPLSCLFIIVFEFSVKRNAGIYYLYIYNIKKKTNKKRKNTVLNPWNPPCALGGGKNGIFRDIFFLSLCLSFFLPVKPSLSQTFARIRWIMRRNMYFLLSLLLFMYLYIYRIRIYTRIAGDTDTKWICARSNFHCTHGKNDTNDRNSSTHAYVYIIHGVNIPRYIIYIVYYDIIYTYIVVGVKGSRRIVRKKIRVYRMIILSFSFDVNQTSYCTLLYIGTLYCWFINKKKIKNKIV